MLKGLLLSVGIILTCLVVGIGFYVAREAKATALVSADQLSSFRQDLSEQPITRFDEVAVMGSDVVNFMKQQLGSYKEGEEAPLYITIHTDTLGATYNNKTYLSEVRDFNSSRYINPTESFVGEVVEDDNDVIVGVIFNQE